MRNRKTSKFLLGVIIFNFLIGCEKFQRDDYLVMITDTINDSYSYKNIKGDTIIAFKKYPICFTDTFKNYAVVLKPQNGFVAIDRNENVLYEVLPFDNGPDYTSEGLIRIIKNGKVGYADSQTGKIIIEPKFKFAFPFKNGVAKVSYEGKIETDGEHSAWKSNKWFYIDKLGKKKNGL